MFIIKKNSQIKKVYKMCLLELRQLSVQHKSQNEDYVHGEEKNGFQNVFFEKTNAKKTLIFWNVFRNGSRKKKNYSK